MKRLADPAHLLILDQLLEDAGWDNPGRFIVLPRFYDNPRPLVEFEGHPCDVLHEMWAKDPLAVGEVVGGQSSLALVVEGRRHLRIEELKATQPERYNTLVAVAAEEAAEEHGGDLEQIETLVQRGWELTMAELSPLVLPEELTMQVRNTIIVSRDGTTQAVVRDLGGATKVLDEIPAERLSLSRVPHFMWQFLTGQEPTDEAQEAQ